MVVIEKTDKQWDTVEFSTIEPKELQPYKMVDKDALRFPYKPEKLETSPPM